MKHTRLGVRGNEVRRIRINKVTSTGQGERGRSLVPPIHKGFDRFCQEGSTQSCFLCLLLLSLTSSAYLYIYIYLYPCPQSVAPPPLSIMPDDCHTFEEGSSELLGAR